MGFLQTVRQYGSTVAKCVFCVLVLGILRTALRVDMDRGIMPQPLMQYKVTAKDAHIPYELRGGHPLLRTRTYPNSPRNKTCDKCFKYIYNTMLRPTSCDANGDIKLLIFLTTVPKAREERDAIRKTWLSVTENNTRSVRYMWLLGSDWPAKEQAEIEQEHQQFGDILQDDFIDSYYNLSIKVMSAFNFALHTNCRRAEFVMRTADDGHVNIHNVLDLLQKQSKLREIQHDMFGPCKGKSAVVRNKRNKWAVTLNEWGRELYPAYCAGTTFIMSTPTMNKLYRAAENVPYFVMEDVYFGEVARQAGIHITKRNFFLLKVPTINLEWKKPCSRLPEGWRAIHEVSKKKQLEIWKYCHQSKSIPSG